MSSKDPLGSTANILLILLITLVLLYFGQDFLIPLVLALMNWSLLNALADYIVKIPLGPCNCPEN